MTLLAISVDAPAESRAFAAQLGAWFPLLSDPEGMIARQYTGMSSDAAALPGVTVIDRDGRIAFRNVASAKDDRTTTPELLAILDRTVGTHGPVATNSGYAALERMQLALSLGVAHVKDYAKDATGTVTSGTGSLAALFPLGRHLLFGPMIASEPRTAPLDLEAAVVLREPFAGNIAAAQLTAAYGYSVFDTKGQTGSLRLGIWFAYSPQAAFTFDLGGALHGEELELFATFGIARLIRTH
ncbi:hypothetical protein BH11MYX1_BH11MYX1_15110 [soil metagenome]